MITRKLVIGDPVAGAGGDTWYFFAGVQALTNNLLLIYEFSPSNPTGVSTSINITPATQQATSSSGLCTIGQDANASPVVYAKMFIEVVGMIGIVPTLAQLQSLYLTGINGG
jgi:hypothetical protein